MSWKRYAPFQNQPEAKTAFRNIETELDKFAVEYNRQIAALSPTSAGPVVSVFGRGGAVALIKGFQALPTTIQNYEVVMFKNATLTGASWAATNSTNVDLDETATAVTGGAMIAQSYATATSQGRDAATVNAGYNWDNQLGISLAGVSDIYTLAIRTLDATPSGDAWGSISFYDLTTQ